VIDDVLFSFLQAFFQGKLKISGNMGLAMKMKELQSSVPKPKL
jgi:putative sterol carrier protein